jgi:hypothetical protein
MPLTAPVTIAARSAGATEAMPPVPVMAGELRDISAAGLCMNLPQPLPTGAATSVTVELPSVTGGQVLVRLEAQVASVRPSGPDAWSVGVRTTAIDAESHRHVLEYVYVVASQRRLAGSREHHALLPLPHLDLPHVGTAPSFDLRVGSRGHAPAGAPSGTMPARAS